MRHVAVIGNYLPRQCGIATFTTDLCEHIASQFEEMEVIALPVNDRPDGYAYPERVRFELVEDDLRSYRRAADFLNINSVDVVCLQHEYGIFGGRAGSHVLTLLREIQTPLVTTLHTILREPTAEQRAVLTEISALSDRLVVMSQRGAEFLQEIYGVPEAKIAIIPHGIPDVPFIDPNFYKDRFGVEGKGVLLTFGLLSPNKGIEHAIEAMPAILERHPETVYIILGATHPNVKLQEGESYRLSLQRLAKSKGIDSHVIFYDRFVRLEELLEFIGAADVYITPYLNKEQIVSGTLAYSLGTGKAVISTPYWYAEELLEDGRGVLVPFRDARAIAEAVAGLLDNEARRHAMRKRAYLFARQMVWPQVAHAYVELFAQAREERMRSPRAVSVVKALDDRPSELPEVRLDHLAHLSDDTGLLQHAVFHVPNYSQGYTTDDNARALVLTVLLEELGGRTALQAVSLSRRYLAFLWHAFNPGLGRFRNFLGYDRRWQEETGTEDCHARALWALGVTVGRSQDGGLRGTAGRLFDQALPVAQAFTSPRAWAFALLGLHAYLIRFYGDHRAHHTVDLLGSRLMGLLQTNRTEDWVWFEDRLTYGNARLPHALLLAGEILGKDEVTAAGLETLRWLVKVQRSEEGHFVPIGNKGFFVCGGERARFDQQPIEAECTVSACLEAYRITGEPSWLQEAERAFEWFLGRNDLGLPLYDPKTGGCHDGLHPDRVNQNQGAESTLSFLLSLAQLRLADTVLEPQVS